MESTRIRSTQEASRAQVIRFRQSPVTYTQKKGDYDANHASRFLLRFFVPTACGAPAVGPTPSADGIIFIADHATLQPGQCTLLHWDVKEGLGVVLNGKAVPKAGEKVCPSETQVFELLVDVGTHIERRSLEVVVGGEPAQMEAGRPEARSAQIFSDNL